MEELIELAECENIDIVYLPLLKHREGLWGMYVPGKQGEKPTIYMDAELDDNPKLYRLARCILAEELGHHFTGIGSVFKIHANYNLKKKTTADDEKALRWATNKLIPTDELLSTIKDGTHECPNLVDYFGVTAWFMFCKMELLQYHVRAKHKEISKVLTRSLASKVKISCIY